MSHIGTAEPALFYIAGKNLTDIFLFPFFSLRVDTIKLLIDYGMYTMFSSTIQFGIIV